MTVYHFKCPGCEKSFRTGPDMRLGPGQVQCGKCGCVFNTGLKNWNEYTAREKPPLIVKELFDPYSSKNPFEWMYMHLMMSAMVTVLVFGAAFLFRMLSDPGTLTATAVFGVYPALLVFRLIRRIVVCKRFAGTGKPPVWG